ncbi:MAG TPA: PAS domain-containing protein [Myxococcales bacterium]
MGGARLLVPMAVLAMYALLAGTGPALLATALATGGMAGLVLMPHPGPEPVEPQLSFVRLAAFLLAAALTVAVAGQQRRAWKERARRAALETESQARLRVLTEAMPQFVFVARPSGAMEYVNAQWTRYSGLDLDATRRAGWEGCIHPDDLGLSRRTWAQTVAGDAPREQELRYRAADGSYRWFSVVFAPLSRGPSGHPTQWIGTATDVHERKTAEEALRASEEQFRQLAEAVPQLVWITCPDGHVLYLNHRWREYLGAPPEDSGDDWIQQLHPDDAAPTARRWQHSVRTGEPYETEYRLRRSADGAYRWFLSRALPLRGEDGRIARWIGTCTDIDDQKRAQAELAQAKQSLEEADRHKNEFLALLSHELRNPLAPIRNSVYVLERAPSGGAQARRALSVIDRQVGLLTRLIEDLLDLTRIARGKVRLQRERLELGELVRRAAEDRRSVFARNRVAFELSSPGQPLWADLDAVRLSQVVANLLGNAAKFTPPGGRVTLSLAADGPQAVLRVRDTGVGIDPALLARLFQPFVQAERTLDHNRGGLGLGLALVRGLVELHGGRVSASSEGLGKGAEFEVRLPLAPSVAAAAPPPGAPRRPAGTHARRILVIEDNRDAAESLKEVLELDQHQVELAGSGPEGVALARATRPDLILCDIGLPGMDGYEVARTLRADSDPGLRRTPLVALSGFAAQEDVDRARAAGFDRHVAKPVEVSVLEGMLDT